MEHTIVVIGAGGVGIAAARRIAGGRKIVFGSRSRKSLDAAKEALEWEGHVVETHQVDISNAQEVHDFAQKAAQAGSLDVVVHTSGVSPAGGTTVQQVLDVDLVGTANVIDAFLDVVTTGTSVICISSFAGYLAPGIMPITPELEAHLANNPTAKLLQHEGLEPMRSMQTGLAYSIAKKANNLRVQGFAGAYGAKGARLNSVSPAVIMTRMGHAELAENEASIGGLRQASALKRHATPEDVASAIAFLAGRESAFMTGADIRLDGGAWPGVKWSGLLGKQGSANGLNGSTV